MKPLRVWQSVLDPAGPQAAHIADHTWFLLAITTVVGLCVLAALAVGLRRGYRRRLEAPFFDDVRTERNLWRGVSVALVATVVILFAILVGSFLTGRALAALRTSSAVTISVVGHQFWWEIQYDDPIPSRRVTTANELHIPAGRPVVLNVTSRDVIHSFWVPMLHGKRDLIPGYMTSFWIQADRPGMFQGQCAEFCGRQHAHMAFQVVAHAGGDFDAWLDARRSSAAPDPGNATARRGRDLFLGGRCAGCHNIAGTPAYGQIGPDLTHVASRPTIGAGTLPNTHAGLVRWIVNPQLDKPGNQMPANPLPAADLDAIASYLETLK
jgi:cytochrome c oxidase subunit 2